MIEFERVDTITLAGGGNRCWWQAGFLEVIAQADLLRARSFSGTSAGAAMAMALLGGTLSDSIAGCQQGFGANRSIFGKRRGAWFAQEEIYPAWLRTFVSAQSLATIKQSGIEIYVGVARLPRAMPSWLSTSLGVIAYIAERNQSAQLPQRWAHRIGLSIQLHPLHAISNIDEAIHLLTCAAAAPPFIRSRILNGEAAVDGGFANSAPRLPITDQARNHLVLLTRFDARHPVCFEFEGRTYIQPSKAVPVSTWDCTYRTDITAAIDLGRRDAKALIRTRPAGLRVSWRAWL